MEALRAAWIAHPLGISDPTLKFSFAQIRLRRNLKAIQEQVTTSEQPLDLLLAQLVQIKLDILDKSNHQQRQDYKQVRREIREIELQEANRLCSLSRVKWMGTRDKPYKTFFLLVNAKQQREARPILLTNEDTIIEDESEIMGEVEHFYITLHI